MLTLGLGKDLSSPSSSSRLSSVAARNRFAAPDVDHQIEVSIALICASIIGCQFNLANKRRQGGKKERNSVLLINRDAGIGGEIDMAVGGEELVEDNK